jgi:D-glycero-alpha-D-manno-heptose-7-phosphate kinase
MIISRTPFRISFFGGGTDFPEFYQEHGGAVLATTINQYCYITLHRLAPFFRYGFKANYARTEAVQKPEDFEHPLIRECLLHLDVKEGLEIAHVADLPGRTGLGTSSSFTVGLLHALHVLRSERVTAEDLAREAIHVERVRVGDAGGHQDQYAAAYGGLNRFVFTKQGRVEAMRLPLGAARLREIEQHLLLFFMGTEQSAEGILTEQKKRTMQNSTTLRQMAHLVEEAGGILVSDQNLAAFGRLLHESWRMKRSLAGGISNSDIDAAYDAAHRAGAFGGKLLGAGGRGFLLLCAPPETHAKIRHQLKTLKEVTFAFSATGSEIIFNSDQR